MLRLRNDVDCDLLRELKPALAFAAFASVSVVATAAEAAAAAAAEVAAALAAAAACAAPAAASSSSSSLELLLLEPLLSLPLPLSLLLLELFFFVLERPLRLELELELEFDDELLLDTERTGLLFNAAAPSVFAFVAPPCPVANSFVGVVGREFEGDSEDELELARESSDSMLMPIYYDTECRL